MKALLRYTTTASTRDRHQAQPPTKGGDRQRYHQGENPRAFESSTIIIVYTCAAWNMRYQDLFYSYVTKVFNSNTSWYFKKWVDN